MLRQFFYFLSECQRILTCVWVGHKIIFSQGLAYDLEICWVLGLTYYCALVFRFFFYCLPTHWHWHNYSIAIFTICLCSSLSVYSFAYIHCTSVTVVNSTISVMGFQSAVSITLKGFLKHSFVHSCDDFCLLHFIHSPLVSLHFTPVGGIFNSIQSFFCEQILWVNPKRA